MVVSLLFFLCFYLFWGVFLFLRRPGLRVVRSARFARRGGLSGAKKISPKQLKTQKQSKRDTPKLAARAAERRFVVRKQKRHRHMANKKRK